MGSSTPPVLHTTCILLVLIHGYLCATSLTPTETFSSDVSLVANDVYHLFWKYDNDTITFEVHAKVLGWVGFGLSPNGGMTGADIVIGWVNNGVAYFKDRYATGNAMPTVDASQDWILLAGSETSTHTVLKFKRPLYLCDSEDRNVTAETMRVIFAYSTTDPTDHTTVAYHSSSRGAKSVMLVATHSTTPTMPADAFYVDYLNPNVTIPHSSDTTYWCEGFYAPNFTEKHHLIKVEPVVQSGNEAYVHHVLLYACLHTPANISTAQTGFVCYTANMPWGECDAPFVSWSFGGTDYSFPDHVGYPFGGPDSDILYVRMETHYDNPNLTPNVVDGSGLRLWFTKTLRTYDAGLLEAGMQVSPLGQILPGGFNNLNMYGHCAKECLDEGMGTETEIKVFSAMLHSHLLGTGVRVHHYRNGVEQPWMDSDMAYDFNYQETRVISPEVTVQKGDSLMVECVYNTASKTVASVGGQSTANEMCLAYIFYYPRINITKCQSAPTQMQMAGGLNLTYTEYNAVMATYGMIALVTNGSISNQPFHDYVTNYVPVFDADMQAKYQAAIITGDIYLHCEHGQTKKMAVDATNIQSPAVTSTYTPNAEPCGNADAILASTLTTAAPSSATCPALSMTLVLLTTAIFKFIN